MAKKKTTKQIEEVIILDANSPAKEAPKTRKSKNKAPELKVVPPTVKEEPKEVPEKEEYTTIVKDDIKSLRPDGVYGPDEETAPEMGDRLQKEADEYKVKLEEYNSVEELEKIEQEWIDKLNKLDEYLKKVTYIMPKSAVFNHRTYPKSVISSKIARFIGTKEVQFQYTLGMWEMVKLWTSDPTELTYSAYNSTLETLGSLSFKGMNDWESILIINEFFRATNKEYAKDITAYQYLSTMHSHVVGRIQMITPMSQTNAKPVEGTMRVENE